MGGFDSPAEREVIQCDLGSFLVMLQTVLLLNSLLSSTGTLPVCCLLLSRKGRLRMTHFCSVKSPLETLKPCVPSSQQQGGEWQHGKQRQHPIAPALSCICWVIAKFHLQENCYLLLVASASWARSWTADWTLHNTKKIKIPVWRQFQSTYGRQAKARKGDTTGKGIFLSLGVRWFVSCHYRRGTASCNNWQHPQARIARL